MSKKLYQDYFNIDPKYYAAVTADLIQSGKVKWKSFYPHETFIKLLEKTHLVLSGKDPRSLWVEGAYGTGKSHAALTVKSLLEASDEEIRDYFKDYGLSQDLCQKLIVDKNQGKLLTIHRIGSSSIRSDQDLILAVQDSIMAALQAHGIENHGEVSLKDAALKWLEKKANRDYFNNLISEEQYAWHFGGESVDTIVENLRTGSPIQIAKTMRNIISVAEDNGITALCLDIEGLAEWIKNVIAENSISAILFVWDEFTEYFQNNPNSLTGFQTLVQISLSHPFYFMIVSHESRSLFVNAETAKKILDRFVPPVKIELPENMAFQLMAKAMKTTSDPVLLKEWSMYKDQLNDDLLPVRNYIIQSAKKASTMGQKTIISDEELQAIFPIHPYAALMLKHLSVAFGSNQRSMFDFIISNDMDSKAFKWFIGNYGPLDNNNILTIDLLWDFFYGKGQNGLNDDVRIILDSYSLLKSDKLLPEEQRVLKTALLLQALSMRVSDVELLKPNESNVDLAFSGTDWTKGKGRSIAEKLVRDGLLFKKPVGGGKTEYTVANSTGDTATINKKKEEVRKETKTQDLIINANLMSAVNLPARINGRFVMESASTNLPVVLGKPTLHNLVERFGLIVTFAMNDDEAAQIKNQILGAIKSVSTDHIFVDASLTPMGRDLYEQYIESMAYSRYYAQNDKHRASEFQAQAARCLAEWKNKIADGAFMLYDSEHQSGLRFANLTALQDELCAINHKKYYYGLEQYAATDTMFTKSAPALGAECGITQTLKLAFKSSSERNSLSTALAGAWGIDTYWEDETKKSLPIVRIKQEVLRIVKNGFDSPSGRVSMSDIYAAMEVAPFGFLPNNITAFVLGFVLKEYATGDYFWSNGSASESLTVDKMKNMIANAINQSVSPSRSFKEEYIVAMSIEQRSFLKCTSEAFGISTAQCGSIESARDQIRIAMKRLSFPIWCLKSVLAKLELRSSTNVVESVIDDYCGIANTANVNKGTESALADAIGRNVRQYPTIISDLRTLLTNERCRDGMLSYIADYRNGELQKLAAAINDGGAYLDIVKQKFNAGDANWVWSSETADEKISDVILEYKIVVESNKSLPFSSSLRDTIIAWNSRTNNIKMAFEAIKKQVGDLSGFLNELYIMKQTGSLQEQNKQRFLDLLLSQRIAFDRFYADQQTYFKLAVGSFLNDMDDDDVEKLYADIPSGQFTKSSTEYYKYIENTVSQFLQSQAKKKMKDLWLSKTGTKGPDDWSARYDTPILCMFSDDERPTARGIFKIMLESSPSEADINRVIAYLSAASFFDRLNDSNERDRCFIEKIVGDYSVMLGDAQKVRDYLLDHVTDRPYYWMDNGTIQSKIKDFADKQYKTGGYEKAWAVIEKMDAGELRRYLRDLISDDVKVGIAILKNE